MVTKTRNVTKSLAGMEDLVQIRGSHEQIRNKAAAIVHGIDVPFALDTTVEMQALDTTRWTHARVYDAVNLYTDYLYDPTSLVGIPSNEGSGSWLVAVANTIVNDSQFKSFDSLPSAVAFVTANPSTIERVTTASKLSEAECATAGIQYPDGKGDSYVIVGAGTEADDGVNFIDAGTKQLKLDREKGGQRLISLVDKKTSLRMATAANKKYPQNMELNTSNIELFVKGDPLTSSIETGVRLIANPLDHFDIEMKIIGGTINDYPTLIAQNVLNARASRELHIYYDTAQDKIITIIGGSSVGFEIDAPALSDNAIWRFRWTAAQNVFSATKNGVIFFTNRLGVAGVATEPTATTTISSRHSNSPSAYTGSSDIVVSDIIIRNKPRKLVVMGASIYNAAFDNPIESVEYNHAIGSDYDDLVEYATGGNKVADALAELPSILAALTEPAQFVLGIGGNDASFTRPYATAPIAHIDSMEAGITEIINTVKAAGHEISLANTTFRAYPDLLPDNSNGTLPYNLNIQEPLIRELTPEWWDFDKDEPLINAHQWAFDNQDLMQPDGIHFTHAGSDELREWYLGKIAGNKTTNNGGYLIPLHGGGVTSEKFYSFGGLSYSSVMAGYSAEDWYSGIDGVDNRIYGVSLMGIGAQLMLKNISGATIAEGSTVAAADLAQVYFDGTGALIQSGNPLPTNSQWKLTQGAAFFDNNSKMLTRVL